MRGDGGKKRKKGGGLVSITNLESASFVCKSYCVSGECEMDTGKYRSIFHNKKKEKRKWKIGIVRGV